VRTGHQQDALETPLRLRIGYQLKPWNVTNRGQIRIASPQSEVSRLGTGMSRIGRRVREDHDGHRRTDREGNPQSPANRKGLRKEKQGKNERFSSLLGYHQIWTQIPGNRNRGTP
jgi:hypothetical protein